MSLIVQTKLRDVPPHAIAFRPAGRNELEMHSNKTITVFVPRDEAIGFGRLMALPYQVVTSKVDKEAFDSGYLSKESELDTCDVYGNYLVVSAKQQMIMVTLLSKT